MKLKLISDGTSVGSKLIDEDTGETVHGISKLIYEVDANELLSKVTVEFFNIPVEITSKFEVELLDYDKVKQDWTELIVVKTFEKEAKIVSETKPPHISVLSTSTKVIDVETGKNVGAVQKAKVEITPESVKSTMTKVKFSKEDW